MRDTAVVTDSSSGIDPRLLAVYAAIVVLTLIAAAPAPPHLKLDRSSPAADAVLDAAPGEIRLWFSQTPEVAVSMIRVTGPGGQVSLSDLTAGDDNSIVAQVDGSMPAGQYTIDWRTSSGDGHPIRGQIPFAVQATRP